MFVAIKKKSEFQFFSLFFNILKSMRACLTEIETLLLVS